MTSILIQAVAAGQPLLEVRGIKDVNHHTILLDDRSARQVASAVRDLRRSSGSSHSLLM